MTRQIDERRIEPETTPPLGKNHIVLWGAGHTNAHIIRMWAMKPLCDTRLTCISNHPVATYSGMLPAFLAGQCSRSDLEIDLVKLCKLAGVNLIVDSPIGLDREKRLVRFQQRPALRYDLLSIGIGSIPDIPSDTATAPNCVAIKPMQSFPERMLAALLNSVGTNGTARTIRVMVVGAGAAGVEIALCLPRFLSRQGGLETQSVDLVLATRSPEILTGELPATRRLAARALERSSINVLTGETITSDDVAAHDLVIWATGARAAGILGELDLQTDERGFIKIQSTLQSTGDNSIFVVGDSGTLSQTPTPKAGVYAVRQSPVLWDNLQRSLKGQPLRIFKPQRRFLKLLNTADGCAIVQKWPLAAYGKIWRKLKEKIDGDFIEKFRLKPMVSKSSGVMQCSGCGCKLSAAALNSSLQLSTSGERDEALAEPGNAIEDAIRVKGGDGTLVASTDFFSLPTSDAWLAGRLTVIHSSSDILVSGGMPTQLLANVVLPSGDAGAQTEWFHAFQAGAQLEANRMGASIAGGHTIVGPRAEAGFTVLGQLHGKYLGKGNLAAGDQLYVTKPLGVGAAIAAYGAGVCDASTWQEALQSMLQAEIRFPHIAKSLTIAAATDITGFGLAGHLLEMLDASRLSAEIVTECVPILEGAKRLLAAGIRSSLWESNVLSFASRLEMDAGPDQHAALFDPQTCGGILFASQQDFSIIQDAFREANCPAPTPIGRVTAEQRELPLKVTLR